MMFVEIFAPKGSLSDDQRRQITERLIPDMMSAESAPESVIEAGRSICHVVVHEPDAWTVGGRRFLPDEPPRYFVRASVPETWSEGMGPYLVSRVTRLLADIDNDPQRLYKEPHAWVHVVGIPDNSFGTLGKTITSTDVTRMITRSFREEPRDDLPEPPLGMVIDPICGMTVPMEDNDLVLEHAGTVYAFCSSSCRSVFAEDHHIELAS